MKKIISLLLVIALTASVAIGGTMAYLTADAGDEHNVFTVGNIDVSLDEEVGVIGDGGEVKETEEGAEYTEVMPGDYLKKEVTVTNNGKTPAYVAVTVTLNNADKINAAIDGVYEEAPYNYTAEQIQAIYDDIFDGWGINYNPRPGAAGVNDARGVIDGTYGLPAHTLHVDFAKTTAGSTVIGANNWFVAGKEVAGQYWVDGPAEYDGYYTKDMEDYEICYTYYMLLPAGASSTLFNGLNVPAEFDAAQLAMFAGLKIDIEAKAIQADNMGVAEKYVNDTDGKAKTAFEVLAGTIKAEDLDVNNAPAPAIPEDATVVSTTEELNKALTDGETVLYLNPGEYTVSPESKAANLTIYGSSNAVIIHENEAEQGCDYGFQGSTVTFNGVTIDTTRNAEGWAFGYARMNGTYNNCTIKGTYFLYGVSEFNECTFDVSGNAYNVWTYGSSAATFNRCTFNCDGKAIYMDGNGATGTNLTVSICVFKDRTNGESGYNKAAIETGTTYGAKYTLNVSGTTVNGFAVNPDGIGTNSKVWANKNSMDKDHLNVVVDGVDVY